MQRYFIDFSYNGKNYHGWQIQPNGITVQEKMQSALATVLREPVEVVGAGRTDAGVHASMMIAHFEVEEEMETSQLAYRLNRVLPYDIAVRRIYPVTADLHARFSATSRTYHYFLHTAKDPFLAERSYETHYKLDFAAMNEAAAYLLSQTDFASFCKTGTDTKTTLCTVTHACWRQLSETSWRFEITANRFLRNMVRAIVGTLIEVGRHRLSTEDFQAVVKGRNRSGAGESMPAHALFLVDITY